MCSMPRSGCELRVGVAMTDSLIFKVEGVAGKPGLKRDFTGAARIHVQVLDSVVDDEMAVSGTFTGTVDGVEARFTASTPVDLVSHVASPSGPRCWRPRPTSISRRSPTRTDTPSSTVRWTWRGPPPMSWSWRSRWLPVCKPDCRDFAQLAEPT